MTGTQGLRSPSAALGVNVMIIRLKGGKMNVDISIWKPEITVQVKKSVTKNFVAVRIGEYLDGCIVLFM
jgi:hypothetical protein